MNTHIVNRLAIAFLANDWNRTEYTRPEMTNDDDCRYSLLGDWLDDNGLDPEEQLDVALLDSVVAEAVEKGITKLESLPSERNQPCILNFPNGETVRRMVTDIIRTIDGCVVGTIRHGGFTIEVLKDGGSWLEC